MLKKLTKKTAQHQSSTRILNIQSVSVIISSREGSRKLHSKTLTWVLNPIEIHVKMAMFKTLKTHKNEEKNSNENHAASMFII